jgi:hypothetical protein
MIINAVLRGIHAAQTGSSHVVGYERSMHIGKKDISDDHYAPLATAAYGKPELSSDSWQDSFMAGKSEAKSSR